MSSSLGKIVVVGSGAVGLYYGGVLAHAGHDVSFLLRADLEVGREQGIVIHTRGATINVRPPVAGDTTELGPCDLVIIALKATGNDALPDLLRPLVHDRTALLTLQNGLGNDDFLAAHFGAERVLGGLCFVCLNRTAPAVVTHLDHGSLSLGEFIGPPQPRTHALAEAFVAAGIDARVVANLAAERWRKLLWNIPFNGLAIAAGGATVADVLADPDLRRLARLLMDEVLEAARRLGHVIPAEFADHQIERSYSMGPYKPSSLLDWLDRRPVEVEAIWGLPYRRGVEAGAAMPRLETLYYLLKKLCRS